MLTFYKWLAYCTQPYSALGEDYLDPLKRQIAMHESLQRFYETTPENRFTPWLTQLAESPQREGYHAFVAAFQVAIDHFRPILFEDDGMMTSAFENTLSPLLVYRIRQFEI